MQLTSLPWLQTLTRPLLASVLLLLSGCAFGQLAKLSEATQIRTNAAPVTSRNPQDLSDLVPQQRGRQEGLQRTGMSAVPTGGPVPTSLTAADLQAYGIKQVAGRNEDIGAWAEQERKQEQKESEQAAADKASQAADKVRYRANLKVNAPPTLDDVQKYVLKTSMEMSALSASKSRNKDTAVLTSPISFDLRDARTGHRTAVMGNRISDLVCKAQDGMQFCSYTETNVFINYFAEGAHHPPENKIAKKSGLFRWTADGLTGEKGAKGPEIEYINSGGAASNNSGNSGNSSNRGDHNRMEDLQMQRDMDNRQNYQDRQQANPSVQPYNPGKQY